MKIKNTKDLSNRQFGKWEVIRLEIYKRHGKAVWWCRCECGTERGVLAGDLTRRKSLSCGCIRPGRLEKGEASLRQVNTMYKYHAKTRGYTWELSEKQVRELILQNCFYCGSTPSNCRIGTRHNGAAIYNGIDRKHNNLGYNMENCVPCCKICNQAKRDYPLDVFLSWIDRLTAFRRLDLGDR